VRRHYGSIAETARADFEAVVVDASPSVILHRA